MKKSLLLSLCAALSISAAAENQIVTITPSTITQSKTGFFQTMWGVNEEIPVKLTCGANNIQVTNSKFDFERGQTASTGRYIISSTHPAYVVAGFSFTCTAATTGNSIITNEGTTAITTEGTEITSNGNFFQVTGENNVQMLVASISVTLAPVEGITSAIPTESGWYEITNVINQGERSYQGLKVINNENEFRQNASSFYALGIDMNNRAATKPAATYVYIDVTSSENIAIQSANGHWINNNCTSNVSRATTQFRTNCTYTSGNTTHNVNCLNSTIFIGQAWSSYVSESNYNIGQSGGHSTNRFAVVKAIPEETYDIWTVNIPEGNATGELGSHSRVECTNAANKGISKVYNNGKFFITKGTTLTSEDFIADAYGDNAHPAIEINNTDKTITVDYSRTLSTKAEYLEIIYNSIEEKYINASNQDIYGNAVEEAINKLKQIAANAAGEDDVISPEDMAAIANAINLDETYASDIIAFNKTLNGKYFRIQNGLTTTDYMSVENSDNTLGATTATQKPETIWKLEVNDDGKVRLQNYVTKKYLNSNSCAQETKMTLGDEGYYYSLIPGTFVQGNTTTYLFEFKDNESGTYHYLHRGAPAQGQTDGRLVKWNSVSTAKGSGWTLNLVDLPEEVLGAVEEGEEVNPEELAASAIQFDNENDHHTITISHATERLSKHPEYYYGSEMVITISTITRTGDTITRTHADCTEAEDGSILVNVGQKIAAGNYAITIPEGMFKVGNKMSNAISEKFSIESDGATTAISEIGVDTPAAQGAVYDLQGRRLSAPARGINIINGRKVLVK